MKTIFKLLLILLVSASFVGPVEKVYVCDSDTSVAYHQSKECRGLNRCTHTIIYITKKEAINTYGKRACKICY